MSSKIINPKVWTLKYKKIKKKREALSCTNDLNRENSLYINRLIINNYVQ